jgi:hypothetical protein
MGTICVPLLAGLFLYSHMAELLKIRVMLHAAYDIHGKLSMFIVVS